MDTCIPSRMSADLMQKLHALAERRRAHFVELQESGRWVHYYSPEAMVTHLKDAADAAGYWQKMCETSGPTAEAAVIPV